jgi:amino acid transporter
MSALLSLPLALDGESTSQSNTAIAIVSVISMVFVYLLLAGLWYFVFRDKARARRKKDPSD